MIIRRATDEDVTGIANVHITSWQATYANIIPDEYLHSLTIENRKKNWLRNLHTLHTIVFVAENNDGEIIGFAAGGPEQTRDNYYQTELYAIYLLPSYQRQGIGKKILKPMVDYFIGKQYENILIWALHDNPNRIFYEALGGRLVAQKTISICGKALIEVAYGWDDIHDLAERITS